MQPSEAEKRLPKGYLPRRADQARSLDPSLARVIAAQPEFRGWTPSSLCLYQVSGMRVGGSLVRSGDRERGLLFGVWVLAARDSSRHERDAAPLLFGSRGVSLHRAAELTLVRLREADTKIVRASGGGDDTYEVKVGKTLIEWRGRAVGRRAAVGGPLRASWWVDGIRGTEWTASMVLEPKWARALVGSLRVQGKDHLAEALKASPIRFVGPIYGGGAGELAFTR